MASNSSSFCRIFTPFSSPKTPKYPPVLIISQRLRDEGNSANIVDANMNILRQRIEEMKHKERLKISCYGGEEKEKEKGGWNYKRGYDDTRRARVMVAKSIELAALVGGALGFVFLSGSIFIFLYSFVLHINSYY